MKVSNLSFYLSHRFPLMSPVCSEAFPSNFTSLVGPVKSCWRDLRPKLSGKAWVSLRATKPLVVTTSPMVFYLEALEVWVPWQDYRIIISHDLNHTHGVMTSIEPHTFKSCLCSLFSKQALTLLVRLIELVTRLITGEVVVLR
jgi:hypothetical protein